MPGFGHLPELLVIMVLGLLFFGPKRLPEMGNAVGKTIKEFQRSFKSISEPEVKDTTIPSSVPTALPAAMESTTALPTPHEPTTVMPLAHETIVEAPTHAA